MLENKQVSIKSTAKAVVLLNIPNLSLRRKWSQKGAIQKIKYSDLEQAIYDPGVEHMFKSGILYIDDMEVKVALGLEEEGTTEPLKVIVLGDNEKKSFLTEGTLQEFVDKVNTLSYDQKVDLVAYATEINFSDLERLNLIKKAAGQADVKPLNQKDKDDADRTAQSNPWN